MAFFPSLLKSSSRSVHFENTYTSIFGLFFLVDGMKRSTSDECV